MHPNSNTRLGTGTSQQLSTGNSIAFVSFQRPEILTCAGRIKNPPGPGAAEETLKLIAAEGLWGASREAPAALGQVEGRLQAYLSGEIRALACLLHVL